MPSYLQVENISKSYGPKVLFDSIDFNINEGDKIALIAPNGTGKTSLLRILAGKDKSDSGGSIKFLKEIKIAFLEQDFECTPSNTIAQQIFTGDFEQELSAKRILSELDLFPEMVLSSLSGGEVKRVAIAQMLSQDADFLIMDEPTNHLDVDAIEYLENYLKRSRCTLFMVTHDRYFLNRVCNTVMEMDRGSIFIYKGDYENYLTRRDERISNYNAQTEKVRNVLRRELEWMHATPCARSGKAKYRKQAFWELKERAEDTYIQRQVTMDDIGGTTRLGSKVINCKHLSYSYCNQVIVDDFSYNFQRYERVGIVGANGVGKSTFLKLLLESNLPSVERGESLNIGWYRQEGISFNEDDTVLDVVPDTSLLGKFLFPHDMFPNRIARLSGGERRRLYLLTILMRKPNLLVLDEPTNDLDIVTLNILEEYLLEFKGTLIIVTHDRHFLDRLADHLLVFCGGGRIKDFIGGYTEYRSFMKDLRAAERKEALEAERAQKSSGMSRVAARSGGAQSSRKEDATDAECRNEGVAVAGGKGVQQEKKRKLSYKEKMELEALERDIAALEGEKALLEAMLGGGTDNYEEIGRASERFSQVKSELDEKEMRWLELSELQ